MDTKYTPGPWADWGDDEIGLGIPVTEIGSGELGTPDCKQIAYVHPTLDDEDFVLTEEDRANARLIKAAPDLLAALEAAYHLMAKVEASAVCATLYDGRPVELWCKQAHAAIAKAKGESQ